MYPVPYKLLAFVKFFAEYACHRARLGTGRRSGKQHKAEGKIEAIRSADTAMAAAILHAHGDECVPPAEPYLLVPTFNLLISVTGVGGRKHLLFD